MEKKTPTLVKDVTAEGQDFVDVTLAVAAEVNKKQNLGIVIDAYGAGPFMVATKIKGMDLLQVSTNVQLMTRDQRNSLWSLWVHNIVGDRIGSKYC